ncbi:MAG: c-type cytochrome [Planctomycetaceae bacterium]|nr:c-type cytochrome [Planctomycetaceae bacterium]
MTVPDGFSVEIVAAEPDLVNPVAMTFDERGRIWVTESLEYPRREPGPGRDRVKILEDTNQDGRVDKTTIFMEGLNIPSGIAVGYGGVWVANAPDILFVQDIDGDGKADKTEVVVTGFGRSDTHELPNSLTWGPDGWLYGLNGVFNHSHVKYPEGSPLAKTKPDGWQFTVAMFRIHPRTREFQIFAEGTSNPWGIAFDTEGSAFVSACVIDHLWHIVETGYYHRQAGAYPPYTWKIESIVKHKHQKAAYCGLTFFDSDAYPEQYREKLYMGNIHGACINVDKLQRDGSTYFATPEPDFLSANDAWFMPVSQKTGPDGCLYVLDWYDQYHCYQDANRDPAGIERAKGRLYRVRYNETPRAPKFDLAKETDDQLIERLGSPNVYFRDQAQRLLAERSHPAALEKLSQLVRFSSIPKKTRMHALWALIGAEGFNLESLIQELLTDRDASVVGWAVRAGGNIQSRQLTNSISEMTGDIDLKNPDILLQLAIACSKLQYNEENATDSEMRIMKLLAVLSRSGSDPLIPRIVWQNLHPLIEGNERLLINDLGMWLQIKPDQFKSVLPLIAERMIASRNPDVFSIIQLFRRLSTRDISAAGHILKILSTKIQTGELKEESLGKLRRGLSPVISPYIHSETAHPLGFDAAMLAVSWHDDTAIDHVRRAFADARLASELRLRALAALVAAEDEQLFDTLPDVLTAKVAAAPNAKSNADAEFRGQVVASLGKINDPRVAGVILSAYPTLPPDVQPVAINTLTQRAAWAKPLLESIGAKQIPAEALNLNQVRKMLASRDPEVVAAVQQHWGTIREVRNPGNDALIARMRALIRRTPGDPQRGHEVYKKVCGQCHKIYGEGQEVGPDITLNGRNSYDQLLSNVFDPSLVIGAAYQGRTIVTNEGRVVSGLVAEETDQRIVLKIQGGKQEVIPRGEIDEMKISELSLMPEDLEKTLKPQEIVDLFAFITLDKPPDDPAAKQLAGVSDFVPLNTTDPAQFAAVLAEVAPGFTTAAVGERGLGLLREHYGRPVVVRTHPLDRDVACVLTRTADLPAGKRSKLLVSVSHDPQGDWQLIVRANGKTLYDGDISEQSTEKDWLDLSLDLSEFAGKQVKLELDNHPNDWSFEFGYWGRVEIVTDD